MWLTGVLAAEVPASGGNDQLLVMIGGIVVAAFGMIGVVGAAALNNRNKTAPSPPAVANPASDLAWRDYVTGELAVGRARADDSDERDEMQDRRLDHLERVLDRSHPDWRIT